MALRLRILPAVIALNASALLLTACVPAEPDPTGPNPTRTINPTSTPTAAPEPTGSSTPDPEATAVNLACADLISPQAMYDFNPNFLLLNSFTQPLARLRRPHSPPRVSPAVGRTQQAV